MMGLLEVSVLAKDSLRNNVLGEFFQIFINRIFVANFQS